MGILWLRLYFPNRWKECIGSIATEKDKAFNYFICSKRYLDSKSGYYVAEIAIGTKFYDEASGHTYVVQTEKVRLLLVDDLPKNLVAISQRIAKKYHYQGIVKKLSREKNRSSDKFFLCDQVEFGFFPGSIAISKKEELCEIIEFARRHNTAIRRTVPNFPTGKEIDEMLKTRRCNEVCKELFGEVCTFCGVQ